MGVRWLIPLVAILFVVILINLIRKRQLLEAHALLWLLTFGVVAVSPFLIPVLDGASRWLGIKYPPTLYLLVAVFFLMANTLRSTLDVSRLTEQVRRLTQEVAILRQQIESSERPPASPEKPPPTG